jgi:hypothetical protein
MTTTTAAVTALDDDFHFDRMSKRWWETETAWFSFCHPGRHLGGWLYVMARPNIGTVAGGCWIWDDRAHLPWEVPYSSNYTALRLPAGMRLVDAALPTGVCIRLLKPLQRYALGYEDGERLSLALQFDAVMPPVALATGDSAFGQLGHFDQIGRVHGRIRLLGEDIDIDCLAMRDRSWGPRPEHRPRRSSYVTGMATPDHGFLAMTDPTRPGDPVNHGFLWRDGRVGRWTEGQRHVERDAATGFTRRIVLQATDEYGRRLQATAEAVSRIVINRHTFIDVNSMLHWRIDGDEAWGEDQDLWPVALWADARRAAAPARPG